MIVVKRLILLPSDAFLAIQRLLEVLTEEQSESFEIHTVLNGLVDECSYTFVAEDNQREGPSRFVGIGVIFFKQVYSHWIAEIHDVVVDEVCQGRGIGTELVKTLIEQAKEFAKLKKVSFLLNLTNNPDRGNSDFYRKLGFKLAAKACEGEENKTNLYRMTITP